MYVPVVPPYGKLVPLTVVDFDFFRTDFGAGTAAAQVQVHVKPSVDHFHSVDAGLRTNQSSCTFVFFKDGFSGARFARFVRDYCPFKARYEFSNARAFPLIIITIFSGAIRRSRISRGPPNRGWTAYTAKCECHDEQNVTRCPPYREIGYQRAGNSFIF